jgi:type I restriction enzyme S subunit
MEERRLPVGWELVRLEEIGAWGSGGTPKRTNKSFYTNGTIPWLVIGDLNDGLVTTAASSITEDALNCSAAKIVPRNSLLVAMYGSIGKLGITGVECATNQAIANCKPFCELIELQYLFNALMHVKEDLIAKGQGGAQQNISQGILRDQEIPLAPLNEQRRIAAKLDTTLAAVDACRQRLDGMEALLKRFRQAVLAAATSGELTREWREERGIDDCWEEGLLAELMQGKPRNGFSPKPADRVTAVKSLTLSATTTGRFLPQHFKYIDELIAADSHLWLEPGDILIQRANTLDYVGVSALYEGPIRQFIYPDLMMKCRANQKVAPLFLYYLLSSERTRNYFRSNATGTSGNMPKINQQVVMSAPVSWPSLEEQQEIVRRTQQLFSIAYQLEARLIAARRIVERLTPALLAKAFRGELVPQDLNDEPASILLERIRAGRQAEAAASVPSRRGRRQAAANPDPSLVVAAPVTPDLLANLLRECGALTERALLAASELDPRSFYRQLELELKQGRVRRVDDDGQLLVEAAD